jgi:hypothetical protein
MIAESKNSLRLSRIIVYGFSFSFGAVFASLQALRPSSGGFSLVMSWWTVLTLLSGAAIMVPCFQIIVCSQQRRRRRAALALVTLLGVAAFFYPLRFVPHERMAAVFTGLVAAVIVLSGIAGLLLLLRRFFEREEKQNQP